MDNRLVLEAAAKEAAEALEIAQAQNAKKDAAIFKVVAIERVLKLAHSIEIS